MAKPTARHTEFGRPPVINAPAAVSVGPESARRDQLEDACPPRVVNPSDLAVFCRKTLKRVRILGTGQYSVAA